LLYSLIAEKLWALEAENLHLDTAEIMQTTFKALEKMHVRDALYKVEIKNKVHVTNQEIVTELKKYFAELNLNFIFSPDSFTIYGNYDSLRSGTPFSRLLNIKEEDLPLLKIKYGDLVESIEDTVYKLNKGEFTAPIKTNSGWMIFRLIGTNVSTPPNENLNESTNKVKKILKERKTDKIYNEFFYKFFHDKKVTTNGELFWSISDKISELMHSKKIDQKISDSENVFLDASDILKIESELGSDTLKMVFIDFDQDPFTVKDFLRYFIFEGFYSDKVEPEIIAAKLNARTKTLIEQELLAREGYKRGLQNLPEVKRSIEMWQMNYLSKILQAQFADSIKINDEEMKEYSSSNDTLGNKDFVEVNILEILTDSLEVIEKVLNELSDGKDFKQLASIHTKRKWTKENGGEFGFFLSTMYGEIGRIAAEMNAGEIYGPLKIPEGYSIFKLIGKRESGNKLISSGSNQEQKKEIFYKKLDELFVEKTLKLANKYGVSIKKEILKNLEVLDLNMFTYRYMGFGGRITAIPITYPFSEWYNKWQGSLKENP